MLWATVLKTVTKGVTASAYNRGVYLKTKYLLAFQVGIVPANTFCQPNRESRTFPLRERVYDFLSGVFNGLRTRLL